MLVIRIETGMNKRLCLVAGLVKFPCKGVVEVENPELKITIRLPFQSFPSKCCFAWCKKGVSGKIPLELGQGSMKKSYIMYMDA